MTRAVWAPAKRIVPGLGLCIGVTALAEVLEQAEAHIFGQAWLESLVIAIVLGVQIRSFWKPPEEFRRGIDFAGKFLLEVAVVLLGASISAGVVLAAGPALLAGIVVVVAAAILASYSIGRLLGLPHRMATLVACGNSICGNSAIAAAAPVIGATSEEVASSIAFTAVLGVIVVLSLPLLGPVLGLSSLQYGVFAGLTVYAVPQVLAATAPVGALSVQIGTLVKLVRVLMLGPVLFVLGLTARRESGGRPSLKHIVPWFIVGFLLLVLLRSVDAIPHALLKPAASAATILTIISMAALGLGVDIRSVARAGGPVTLAVTLSLLVLGAISLTMIRLLGIA